MSDLARQAHLPPRFANTPVKPRPTIAAASHERSCDVDRRVLTKRGDRPLAFRADANLIAAELPISIPITAIPALSLGDMACSLIFAAPCQLRLLAGPEHGRTSAARLAAYSSG
jgi:hypothetical protein